MATELANLPEIPDVLEVKDLNPAYLAKRDTALEDARALTELSEANYDQAVSVRNVLAEIKKDAERSRTNIKAPFLKMGKLIDDLAKKFRDPVEKEMERLGKLMLPIEKARRDEAARIEAERRALVVSAPSSSDIEDDPLGIHAATKDEVSTKIANLPHVPGASKGIRVLKQLVVTVDDPAKLYAKFPHMVTLTPKLQDLKDLIELEVAKLSTDRKAKDGADKLSPTFIPGVTWRYEEKI